MAYTYASNLPGTYNTILLSLQEIFSTDASEFTDFAGNPSYLFVDNLRQTMHNYADFLDGSLWLYGASIASNDLSQIEAISLPISIQDANYLSTRTDGLDTAVVYLSTNLKMQPAPLSNLTGTGPLIPDPGFELYFCQLNAETSPTDVVVSTDVYPSSQDETNAWGRIRAALLTSGVSYPPNLVDTLTYMQTIQQQTTNYGVTYAPTLSNNLPVSALWNYAICVWVYQDISAVYSNQPDSSFIQAVQILKYSLKQAELQCAEVLAAYRNQSQQTTSSSPLLQSDSLMDLANRALGDYTQWVNIANTNKLLPPYTNPTPQPNLASPGTQLFMPGSNTTNNLGTYLLNFLGVDINWGIPLQSMPSWTGDFETVVGYTNLRWALARRVLTPLKSLIYHPEYGAYLSQYMGQPLTNTNLQLILSYFSIALNNDPRVAKVLNLNPALTAANTLTIQASVQPLGIGVVPTKINFALQPSAISVS